MKVGFCCGLPLPSPWSKEPFDKMGCLRFVRGESGPLSDAARMFEKDMGSLTREED